ncbi:hypothetical protein [Neisseria wadsworthii]|uniref:Uncharacterized protein n=1 Tax=Neisseria wadsworthii 9715 TaxID=1030841 RepID=G4CTC2_9NEIS|nr:hypothetical protein [Neisseria wadsworthii]EGZ44286.1 hypothetical protein HMPREF9370_2332 [Neisseria wadsworthii 9715]QMT35915.1 hypothetical protein H3L96_01230 [Neisseria wadsworthii]
MEILNTKEVEQVSGGCGYCYDYGSTWHVAVAVPVVPVVPVPVVPSYGWGYGYYDCDD